ncbi:MAG: hypothetical protein KAH46_16165, partial [Mycobacterium sp.]|nr:hypothetical protein [Mycobacterium sp.]
RRPGAKKAAAPKAAPKLAPEDEPAAEESPAEESPAEPTAESEPPTTASHGSGNGEARVVGDEPPVKGLGIAKGARRPGKR